MTHYLLALGIVSVWTVFVVWAARSNQHHAKHRHSVIVIIDGEEI